MSAHLIRNIPALHNYYGPAGPGVEVTGKNGVIPELPSRGRWLRVCHPTVILYISGHNGKYITQIYQAGG
jgi:hypothetical protein